LVRTATGDSSETFECDHSYWTIESMTLDGGSDYTESRGPLKIWHAATDIFLNDVKFVGSGNLFFYDGNPKTVVLNRCQFSPSYKIGASSHTYSIFVQGSAGTSIAFNYCKFEGGRSGYRLMAHGLRDGATAYYNNCYFGGFSGQPFYAYDNGNTFVVRNSVFIDHNDDKGGPIDLLSRRSSNNSTLDVDYSYLMPGPDDSHDSPLWGLTNVTDGGHNITWTAPGITKVGHGNGIFCNAVDDSLDDIDTALILALSGVHDTYGSHMTWFVNPGHLIAGAFDTEAAITAMKAIEANGHEIANQGYSHTHMDETTGFIITGTGTGPTVNVDRTADTITCNDSENGNQVVSGFKAKTIAAIVIEINAFTGWSTAVGAPGAVFGFSLGESLDDSSGAQAAGAGYTTQLLLDTSCATGFFKVEIADAKAWIEAQIGGGYQCTTFGYGAGLYSADAQTAVENAGHDLGRTTYVVDGDVEYYTLPKYAIPTSRGHFTPALPLEADIRNVARAIYYSTQLGRYPYMIYNHNFADMNAENLGWFLNELSLINTGGDLKILTYKEWFLLLADTDYYAESAGVYSIASDDEFQPDELTPVWGSVLIDAGVDVGLATDFILTSVPQNTLPDLGLYEVIVTIVPDVVGKTEAAATTDIEAEGLVVGAGSTAASESVDIGDVISQDPVALTAVVPASTVNLTISLGTQVPDVVDETEADAIIAIEAVSLVVGEGTTANSDTIIAGNVISQVPAALAYAEPGSTVELVISLGPAGGGGWEGRAGSWSGTGSWDSSYRWN